MIGQFNMNNIRLLIEKGYKVNIASNFNDTSVWPKERIKEFLAQMDFMNVEYFQIDFSRSAFNLKEHINALKEMKALLKIGEYEFIHTHTPIASAIARLAARKSATKVVYTAHGFHFYKGAPFRNWLIYYPVEKMLSAYTDVLITINREDYFRAFKHFKAKKVCYVPGIGVDLQRYESVSVDISQKRIELGVPEDAILLLSVGELSARKNHIIIIKAMQNLPDNYWYVIVGQGKLKSDLKGEDKTGRVIFLGYRNDIPELMRCADVFVFPSLQEGLPVALMEAMACKLPCVGSDIRGNRDLLPHDVLVHSFKEDKWNEKIQSMVKNPIVVELKKEFLVESVVTEMSKIYDAI